MSSISRNPKMFNLHLCKDARASLHCEACRSWGSKRTQTDAQTRWRVRACGFLAEDLGEAEDADEVVQDVLFAEEVEEVGVILLTSGAKNLDACPLAFRKSDVQDSQGLATLPNGVLRASASEIMPRSST